MQTNSPNSHTPSRPLEPTKDQAGFSDAEFSDGGALASKPAAADWSAPEMRWTLAKGLILIVFVVVTAMLPFCHAEDDRHEKMHMNSLPDDIDSTESENSPQESR